MTRETWVWIVFFATVGLVLAVTVVDWVRDWRQK